MEKKKLNIKSNWNKKLNFSASEMIQIKGGNGDCVPTQSYTDQVPDMPPSQVASICKQC